MANAEETLSKEKTLSKEEAASKEETASKRSVRGAGVKPITEAKPAAEAKPGREPANAVVVPRRCGGARAGAGRKPKVVPRGVELAAEEAVAKALAKHSAQTTQAEQVIEQIPLATAVAIARKRIGKHFPQIVSNLIEISNGATQITRKYELAGLVQVDALTDPDDKGRRLKVKKPLFPNVDPTQMVLVSETEIRFAPDKSANEYLFNRLAGRPAEEKSDPLDDGSPTAVDTLPTREDMYFAFMADLLSRWQESKRRSAQPADASATHIGVIEAGQGNEAGTTPEETS